MALYLNRMTQSSHNLQAAGYPAEQVLTPFDAPPDVHLFVTDRESRFVRVNDALLALHGCRSAADATGKTDHDFHPLRLPTNTSPRIRA